MKHFDLRRFVALLAFILPLFVFSAETVSAQIVPEPRAPGVYQRVAHPGEATVPVMVMGLGGPGLFEVGESVGIDELLVLAGGTALTPAIHKVTIRVYRNDGIDRNLIYEAPMQEMLVERSQYPALRAGDLLMVETRPYTRFGWRDGLTILGAVSTVTLLILRINAVF